MKKPLLAGVAFSQKIRYLKRCDASLKIAFLPYYNNTAYSCGIKFHFYSSYSIRAIT